MRSTSLDGAAPRWVRLGLVIALVPAQIATGLWALFATRHWFDHFPGIGAKLVAAEPPYNAHLASDTGAAFLTTGLALIAAAIGPNAARCTSPCSPA